MAWGGLPPSCRTKQNGCLLLLVGFDSLEAVASETVKVVSWICLTHAQSLNKDEEDPKQTKSIREQIHVTDAALHVA